jgi:hypothetical protein
MNLGNLWYVILVANSGVGKSLVSTLCGLKGLVNAFCGLRVRKSDFHSFAYTKFIVMHHSRTTPDIIKLLSVYGSSTYYRYLCISEIAHCKRPVSRL